MILKAGSKTKKRKSFKTSFPSNIFTVLFHTFLFLETIYASTMWMHCCIHCLMLPTFLPPLFLRISTLYPTPAFSVIPILLTLSLFLHIVVFQFNPCSFSLYAHTTSMFFSCSSDHSLLYSIQVCLWRKAIRPE